MVTKKEIKQLVKKVLLKSNNFEDVFSKVDCTLTSQRNVKAILESLKTSKTNSFKYPVELCGNFKTKTIKVELFNIFDTIRNGSFKADQELLERLIKENILLPTVFFENRKKYTPCGIFYHKFGRLGIRILNQILLFETKKQTLTQADIQIIKNNENTFAFYRQIFPDCYFLIVRTINLNSRNYLDYQDKAETHYFNLLGSRKVFSMDLNAAIPFSYDTGLYLNSLSKPFTK